MEFVLGIDAGGTYLRVKASALSGSCLGFAVGESLGYYSENPASFEKGLTEKIDECLKSFKGDLNFCRFVVAGVSGIDSEEDRVELESVLGKICRCKAICMNDAELANIGINGRCGILLNSGTGSIAYGTGPDGKTARVGGWPLKIFGDEGSGAWIALKTIRLVASWFDGLVNESPLIRYFLNEFSITNQKTFMDFILSYTCAQLAKIGPLVDKAQKEGDSNAKRILTEAAEESFKLVCELADKLGYGKSDSFKVGLWGSNILKSKLHLKHFSSLLKSSFPKATINYSERELIDFATCYALENAR